MLTIICEICYILFVKYKSKKEGIRMHILASQVILDIEALADYFYKHNIFEKEKISFEVFVSEVRNGKREVSLVD